MLYNPQLKGEHTFIPEWWAMIIDDHLCDDRDFTQWKRIGYNKILLYLLSNLFCSFCRSSSPYLSSSPWDADSILLLSKFFSLNLPVQGSIVLLYARSFLFIITSLCLGLLISDQTESQQTAMFISPHGKHLPLLCLLSGSHVPIENMPLPANNLQHRSFQMVLCDCQIHHDQCSGISNDLGKEHSSYVVCMVCFYWSLVFAVLKSARHMRTIRFLLRKNFARFFVTKHC